MKDTDQYIVAIGGSAGSLGPIQAFFDHTPLDHTSYIIIRHMPKNSHSKLKEILNRHSKLQLLEATNGMPIEPNKVYISPSQERMIIKDLTLHFVEIPQGPNRAIDIFFESLAEEAMGDKAIVVILSGAGFDGIKGAGAIKHAGGLVIAQEPLSSEYDSMPKYTIQSGIVDYIRTPEEMPGVIQNYVRATDNKRL